MREWADWRRWAVQVGPSGYKPSSLNILMAGGTPGGGGFHSVVLSYGADVDSVFVQIDRAVSQLPMIPRLVVCRYYQQPGTVDQMVADLGVSRRTMYKLRDSAVNSVFTDARLKKMLKAA
nr:MAG TPA: RNA polymerase sigma factor [Caudoviricetes sp.]